MILASSFPRSSLSVLTASSVDINMIFSEPKLSEELTRKAKLPRVSHATTLPGAVTRAKVVREVRAGLVEGLRGGRHTRHIRG